MSDEQKAYQSRAELPQPPTPLDFLQEVRKKILGNHPSEAQIQAFNETTQGKALSVLEGHFKISETREVEPFVGKQRYFCNSITGGLWAKEGSRFLAMVVNDQFTIVAKDGGEIEIRGRTESESFMPDVAEAITIDQTGKITPSLHQIIW